MHINAPITFETDGRGGGSRGGGADAGHLTFVKDF